MNDFQEKNGNIFIFPNPVGKELLIEFPEFADHDILISVFDITGNIVLEQSQKSGKFLKIDATELNNGFYLLEMISGNKLWQAKFLKQ